MGRLLVCVLCSHSDPIGPPPMQETDAKFRVCCPWPPAADDLVRWAPSQGPPATMELENLPPTPCRAAVRTLLVLLQTEARAPILKASVTRLGL